MATDREDFLRVYNGFTSALSNAAKNADYIYNGVTREVKPFQKIVDLKGEEVDRVLDNTKFVIKDQIMIDGNIQKSTFYFYKDGDLQMTISSSIDNYPEYGPFSIDPISHPEDTMIDREKLSQIYGHIFTGYLAPVLFNSLGITDKDYPTNIT